MVKKKKTKDSAIMRGPLSKADKAFIEANCQFLDSLDIAQRISKSLKQVEQYKNQFLANAPKLIAKRSESEEYRRELTASAYWTSIKTQYTEKELIFYENSYIDYRGQMKDCNTVEIKQIHQLISLDIFMMRHGQDRKNTQVEIDRLEKLLEGLHKRDFETLTDDEKKLIMHSENQLAAYKSTTKDRTTEYKQLLDKHTDILKTLKSTRDQRIKNLEDRGRFLALLHELELTERRKPIGEMTALTQMAMEKEKERLSQPIKYADGTIDIPLLNAETDRDDIE